VGKYQGYELLIHGSQKNQKSGSDPGTWFFFLNIKEWVKESGLNSQFLEETHQFFTNPEPNQRAGVYNFQKPGTGGYNKIKELPDIGVIASFGEICIFCVFLDSKLIEGQLEFPMKLFGYALYSSYKVYMIVRTFSPSKSKPCFGALYTSAS
jgi:hypothetical protein